MRNMGYGLVICILGCFDIIQKGPTNNTQIIIVTKQNFLNKDL